MTTNISMNRCIGIKDAAYLKNLSRLGSMIGIADRQRARDVLNAVEAFSILSVEQAKNDFVVRKGSAYTIVSP